MTFMVMKKLIENKNTQYMNGTVTKEAYNLWKANDVEKKLDVYLAFNRITSEQYEELSGMLLDLSEDEPVI